MDYQNHLPASSKYMCSKAYIEKSVLLAPVIEIPRRDIQRGIEISSKINHAEYIFPC